MGRVELGSNPEHPHKKAVAVGTPLTPALRLGKGDRNRRVKGIKVTVVWRDTCHHAWPP